MNRAAVGAMTLMLLAPLAADSGPAPSEPWREIELDGSLLPFIRVAAEEAALKNLPIEKYRLVIVDEREVVGFIFEGANRPPGARGATGDPPAYEIQVRKSDRKIVVSSYIR